MKRAICLSVLLCAGVALAAPRGPRPQTFTGQISDSACGLHHMIPNASARKCTLQCVQMGAKFVLADRVHHKIYALSDQAKAQPWAGEDVKVSGELKRSTIEV
ncbi:MAG TPA: hypothetical protein VFZ08_01640, partial [Terriglobia bacterium]|nr:hypothetical protein [Terriglobia bacterium]